MPRLAGSSFHLSSQGAFELQPTGMRKGSRNTPSFKDSSGDWHTAYVLTWHWPKLAAGESGHAAALLGDTVPY